MTATILYMSGIVHGSWYHTPLKVSRVLYGRDRMVVGYTTTYAMIAYHH